MMLLAAETLRKLTEAICQAGGSTPQEAAKVAQRLLEANLAGHDSHGVGMLPAYVESLQEGRLRANRHASIATDHGAILIVDGNDGYGQVVAEEAMEMALARVAAHGVVVLALRNAHHIGRIGAWGEMATDAGYLSIHYVNGIASLLVAPYGGSDARFTTNPYCTALPATKKHPRIVLDMATTGIAMGKVRVAHNLGITVAPGNLIDANGKPTTDPGTMYREPTGALLSAGLHKGYGLAVICELLAGALTGGGTFSLARRDGVSIINNMLAIILDPAKFGEPGAFEAEIDSFVDWIKASPPREGFDAVMVPGDPERKAAKARLVDGIPMDPQTWRDIQQAAAALGVDVAAIVAAQQ